MRYWFFSLIFLQILNSYCLSIQDIISIHKSNFENISDNSSYIYNLSTKLNKNGQITFSNENHLFRRNGVKTLYVQDFSGWYPNQEDIKRNPTNQIYVKSFDGSISRGNTIVRQYYDGYITTGMPIVSLGFLDKIKAIKHEHDKQITQKSNNSPRNLPVGEIFDGMRGQEPGYRNWDHFLECAGYSIGRTSESRPWYLIMQNGSSSMEVLNDGTVRITGELVSKDEVLRDNPGISESEAQSFSRSKTYELILSPTKGASVVSAKLFNENQKEPFAQLTVLKQSRDPNTGVWYPVRFLHEVETGRISGKLKKQSISFDLREISFEPVDDSVFTDIWVDEQAVKDHRVGKLFYYLENEVKNYHEDFYEDLTNIEKERQLEVIADQSIEGVLDSALENNGAISQPSEEYIVHRPDNSKQKSSSQNIIPIIVIVVLVTVITILLMVLYIRRDK